jgi:integrase-like protein
MTLHPSITGGHSRASWAEIERAPSVTGGARKNPVRSIQRTRNLFGSPAQGGLHRNAHIGRAIEVAHDDPPKFPRTAYLSFGKSDVINNTILAFAQGRRAVHPCHSHMLRHACGFKLANDGHDTRAIQAYLGHRSIMSTVRYTALTPNRFKNFFHPIVAPLPLRLDGSARLPR